MQLGQPIYDKHKRILLAAGRSIHSKLLSRIKQMNISYLFVEDAESEGITIDEMIDMPTWIDAINIVEQLFKEEKVMFSAKLFYEFQQLVKKLIQEVSRRSALVLIPTSSISEENRLYAHSINVTLLALQIGKKLSYTQFQLKDLAIGCLLHDIGKRVYQDERHTEKGFEILRYNREISFLSAHVAYQHHETIDGKGYPRGISDIHEYAQICGVANYYDHLISTEMILPHEVVERLMASSDVTYPQHIIQAFTHSVPSYFPGTKVELSNGELAIVTRLDSDLHRPTIRYLKSNEEISLVNYTTLLIKKVIKDD